MSVKESITVGDARRVRHCLAEQGHDERARVAEREGAHEANDEYAASSAKFRKQCVHEKRGQHEQNRCRVKVRVDRLICIVQQHWRVQLHTSERPVSLHEDDSALSKVNECIELP